MNHSEIQRLLRALPGRCLVVTPSPGYAIVAASDGWLREASAGPEIIGRPLLEVVGGANSAEPADPLSESLDRVVATCVPDDMGTIGYDIHGRQTAGFIGRRWSVVNAPVLDASGSVEYIVHCVEDTAPKSSRDAAAILESITEGFFTIDRQWRFDYANPEAHRILGRHPGDLQGRKVWDEYPGLEQTEFAPAYRHTMATREKRSVTAFYPDMGSWYEVTAFPAPEGISVYFRDITTQKDAEAERERLVLESDNQRRMYETALDSTPDFVYVFDLEHHVIYANQSLLTMWGVDDARGKKWMQLGYEQWHADMHDREIDQVISTRAPIRGEIPFTGTNGRRIYEYIFSPVFDPRGEVVAVAGTTRDITERQAAEQALREQAHRLAEADRAKDEFLATLSHELRNPLAPLRNSIELLRMIGRDTGQSATIHMMMERQVNHLVRLVDDLLETSRISRGNLSLRVERVALEAVVSNAVETVESLVGAVGHELSIDLPAQPVWLQGDPVRLAQILGNLLSNAARYTPDGGRIEVRASAQGDEAVIVVRDNGMGITPEELPRMFEMFSRGGRDSSRSQGGLGIGLALSRKLAEMHGGTLVGSSDGIGQGSEFTLRVPLAESAPEHADAPAEVHGQLVRSRVLVVDDNIDAGDSLGQVLDLLGAEARVVRDGEQALDMFADWRPAVVVLDIGMPGMNGYEVARTLHARFPDHGATLVALTGWGQENDRRQAREAGFHHHLLKPADIGVLRELLASVGPGHSLAATNL